MMVISYEREFLGLLTGMHLLSNGTTQTIDGRITGSKDRGPYPAGGGGIVEEFTDRWERAWSDRARRELVEDARKQVAAYRRAPAPPVIEHGSTAWKREIANSDKPDKELVRLYSLSRQTLWRYRRDYRERPSRHPSERTAA